MQNLEEYIIKLRDQFSGGIRNAKNETAGLRNEVAHAQGGIQSLGKFALKAFAGFQAYRAVTGIIELGASMEQTRVQFRTFLGDAELANKTIADLDQFANVTPFSNDEVLKAGKALLAFGTPVEQLKTDLTRVGDIASGTGKNFNELAVIYGKARVAGTLYAEDINQLTEAGIPVIQQFAKQLGVSENQVKKMGSEGKISFSNLQTAFSDLTGEGGMFFNLMDAQSKTFGGQLSTMKGQMQTVGVSIGEALLPVLQPIVQKLGEFATWVSANKELIAQWVPVIVKFVGVVLAVIAAIRIWMGVQAMINFLLNANPIGVIIMAIAALVAAVVWAYNESETFRNVLNSMWEVIKMVGELLYDRFIYPFVWLYQVLKDNYEQGGLMKTIIDSIAAALHWLGDAISSVIDWFIDLPNKAIAGFEVIKTKVQALVDAVVGAFKLLTNPFDEKGRAEGLAQLQKGMEGFNKSASEIYNAALDKRHEEQAKAQAEYDAKKAAGQNPMAPNGKAGGILPPPGTNPNAKSSGSAGISEVKSSAPKVFNINIESLVKELTVSTTNLTGSSSKLKEEITKLLLEAVNDLQAQAG